MPSIDVQAPLQKKRARISTIEFWRFAFTVLVGVYHLEIFFFAAQKKVFPSGTSAVEFFFILAGFTMAMSAKRRNDSRTERMSPKQARALALDFVVKKLKAIYPLLVVALLLGFVVYPLLSPRPAYGMGFGGNSSILHTLMNSEWEFLLLVGTPFGFNEGMAPVVPLWFLTQLLVIGYAYTYAISRHYEFVNFAAPIIGVLGYIYFTLNSSLLIDHAIQMGMFNAGTVHAIAEMSLGIALFQLYDYLSKKNFNVFWKVVLSLFEIYAIYRLFALTLFQDVSLDNFRKIVYLMIIILFSFLNVTAFSRLINRSFWRVLGHISLAMYLCHFHLINVYMGLRPRIFGVANVYRMTDMAPKEMALYTLLVMVVATLMTLLVAGIGRLYRKLSAPKVAVAADTE